MKNNKRSKYCLISMLMVMLSVGMTLLAFWTMGM